MVALQLAQPGAEAERTALAERLRNLQKEYQTRHAFWTKAPLSDTIARKFLDEAHAPVPRFHEIAHNRLVPAVNSGDRTAVDAALLAMGVEYQMHRKAIDSVVELSNTENAATEKDAGQLLSDARIALAVVFGVSLALGLALFVAVSRPLTRDMES